MIRLTTGIIIIITTFLIASSLLAHSGRTDASGCHTCRTNCYSWGLSTGEYHCHRAKSSAPQPLEPVTSHKSETGVGYTEPAPEYKEPVASDESEPVIEEVEFTPEIKEPVTTKSVKSVVVPDTNNNVSTEEDIDLTWVWVLLAGGVGYFIAKSKK